MRLAGGDTAIRDPWGLALAVLDDAFDGRPPLDMIPLFARVPPRDLERVQRLLTSSVRLPQAHGAGRYFDAIGAMLLGRTDARYEGQIALALSGIADAGEKGRYDYAFDRQSAPWTIDLRPMIHEIVRDVRAGIAAPVIAARFHNTLAVSTAETVRVAIGAHGELPVVLTGGCFQNPLLAEGVVRALAPECAVYLHRDVPPGDGGIALGQAVVAAAMVRRSDHEENGSCV